MSKTITECKNCHNKFSGNFCNECGQKAPTYRIDLKQILHSFFHAMTHVDGGLLYTAKEMIIRPGHTIREYFEGKRVKHPNPLLTLLVIGGLCSLVYYKLELRLLNSYKINEMDAGLKVIDAKFFAALYIGYSLVFSLCDYIIFRFKKYNFSELFVLNVFISNQVLLFQLCLVPLWLLGRHYGINDYFRMIVGMCFLAYFLYVRYQFFGVNKDKRSRNKLVIEGVLFFFLFAIFGWKTFSHLFGY